MRIVNSKIFSISIPFRFQFKHNVKSRKFSETVIVKVIDEKGNIGYGEGTPRSYVTGESSKYCVDYFENWVRPWVENCLLPDDLSGNLEFLAFLSKWHKDFPEIPTSGIIAWNSIRCAVELAIIHCFLNRTHQCLSDYLPPKRTKLIYSSAIPSINPVGAGLFAGSMRLAGIRELKIKLNHQNDLKRIQFVRFFSGSKAKLRVDANMAYSFNDKDDLNFLTSLDRENIESIEQPFIRENYKEWRNLRNRISTDLMVDESLITFQDAKMLIEHQSCDAFNLRISRLGGIYPMLELAEFADFNEIWYQIGAHVGETGILASVGQHMAAYLEKARFLEGSIGNLLLVHDIVKEKVRMGYGGIAYPNEGVGFGISVESDLVNKYLNK